MEQLEEKTNEGAHLDDDEQSIGVVQQIYQQQQEPVLSNYALEYTEIMGASHINKDDKAQLIKKLFRKEKIKYNKDSFYEKMTVRIADHMPNFQILTLDVFYGNFIVPVTVYCQKEQSCTHNLSNRDNRQDVTLYFPDIQDNDKVIKCFPIVHPQQPSKRFALALKQFCLLRIASGLGVGPKPMSHGGFDLIFSENCVQFTMERCLELSSIFKQLSEITMQSLRKKLSLLHLFHFIHMDIKQPNIMYSKLSSEIVFIDFGYSKIIREEIGYQSKSQFAGSIGYCAPQMVSAFHKDQNTQKIDLYYNDAHCFKSTVESIFEERRNLSKAAFVLNDFASQPQMSYAINPLEMETIEKYRDQQNKTRLRKMLYFRQEVLRDSFYRKLLIKNKTNFIEFIMEFRYYQYLQQIYRFIISTVDEKKRTVQYTKRMEFKKQVLFRSQSKFDNSDQRSFFSINNTFSQKLQLEIQKSTQFTLLKENTTVILQTNENIKDMLLSPLAIKRMTQLEYIELVSRAADLTTSMTTLQQKIKICQLYKQNAPPINVDIQLTSNQHEIQFCYKHLFYYFKQTLLNKIEKVIPRAIVNLIILEARTIQQVQKFLKNMEEKRIFYPQLCLILIQLKKSLVWFITKISSRYNRDTKLSIDLWIRDALKTVGGYYNGILFQIACQFCPCCEEHCDQMELNNVKIIRQQLYNILQFRLPRFNSGSRILHLPFMLTKFQLEDFLIQ